MAPMFVYWDAVGGFTNSRSLIFDGSSQFLSSLGDNSASSTKCTISVWLKRTVASANHIAWIGVVTAGSAYTELQIDTSNRINIIGFTPTFNAASPTGVFTDTATWHNVCAAIDTGQVSSTDRIKLWYDGTLLTTTGTSPTQSATLSLSSGAATSFIGQFSAGTQRFSGLMDQFYYIDGQALDPTYFITGTPGVPKAFSGSYNGVFDFFLNFEDNTNTTTLGVDNSGESNNWTLNGMTTSNSTTSVP